MSRGFVKEGDQEEVPMVLPRAFLPDGVPNYVTEEGLKLLHEEMESLKKEWVDAGNNYVIKNYVDAKMRLLSERINNAVLIDVKKSDSDVVSFGSYVKYNDRVIRIVGVDEADASKGLISFISPIAKALIGKKKGDKFEIEVPKGTDIIEIQDVAHIMTLTFTKETKTTVKESIAKNNSRIIKNKETVVVKHNVETSSDDSDSQSSDSQSHNISFSKVFFPENNPTDFLPLINKQGNIVGRALLCEIHNGNRVLHPAVHLWVYNSKNEVVAKYWWHVAFGETAEKTLKRKIKEITSDNLKTKFKKQYIRETKEEIELVSVYISKHDGEVIASPIDNFYEKIFEND